jgi:hypothetical protein
MYCSSDKSTLFENLTNFAPGSFPHELTTDTDYEQACTNCEVRVRISTAAEHVSVKTALFHDRRKAGSRGRALDRDLPLLGLKQGDRLEPRPGLRDVSLFEALQLPADIVFWRPSAESTVHHRNPLFSASLGVGYDCLIIDILHCLHLGVLQRYVSFCWWSLVMSNAFKVRATNEDELISMSVSRLRALLFDFYPRYRRLHTDHSTLTELSDLTVKTLGPKGSYLLKTKAAMTRPLVPFTVEVLQRFGDSLPQRSALHAAGKALNQVLLTLRAKPEIVAPAAIQDTRAPRLCVASGPHTADPCRLQEGQCNTISTGAFACASNAFPTLRCPFCNLLESRNPTRSA